MACQVAYPLVDGVARDRLTVLTVCLGFAAALAHAVGRHGARLAVPAFAAALALTGAVEVCGVRAGLPFGDYAYGGGLGPDALGVPLLVPAAWAMTAYPALVVGRRLARGRGRLAVVVVAGWALASWDVFLDPQMVDAGHWTWADPTPGLPGAPGVPWTNYAGWVAVAVVLMALLDRILPDPAPEERGTRADLLPGLIYLWTYASQVLANAVFFGRPGLALTGGLLMGAVAVPYARTLRRQC